MKAKILVALVLGLIISVFSWLWLGEKAKISNMNKHVAEAQERAASARDELIKIQDINNQQKESLAALNKKAETLENSLNQELERQGQMESATRGAERLLQAARDESKGLAEELERSRKREENAKFRLQELEKSEAELKEKLAGAEAILANQGLSATSTAGSSSPCPPAEEQKIKDHLMTEAANLRLEINRAQAELSALQERLMIDYEKMAKLKKELAILSSQAEQKALPGTLSAVYESLSTTFKKQIESGEITITQLNGNFSIDFAQDLLFGGGAALSPSGQNLLELAAGPLKGLSLKQIIISAHSDTGPVNKAYSRQFPSNWELTAAQAGAVASYLSDKKYFEQNIISALGRADADPIAPNDSPENMRKNRRLEINVSKN